jgi:DNA-binding transcriptional LysR family regulator
LAALESEFSVDYFLSVVTTRAPKKSLGLIFLPADIGRGNPDLVPAFEHLGPVLNVPIWLVCHQELRTNRRIRRVYDFIAEELSLNLAAI